MEINATTLEELQKQVNLIIENIVNTYNLKMPGINTDNLTSEHEPIGINVETANVSSLLLLLI